jgi:hypothetical protein
VDGKAIDAVTVSDNSRGLASEFVQKINRAALSICLDGWIKGDAAIIGSTADPKRFSFTWVPTGEVFSYEQFPDFYNKFKSDAEQVSVNIQLLLLTKQTNRQNDRSKLAHFM